MVESELVYVNNNYNYNTLGKDCRTVALILVKIVVQYSISLVALILVKIVVQ